MKEASKPAATGTWFSVVLLILPISMIVWAFVTKAQLPFDQLGFLKFVLAVSSGSFLFAWYFSFWKIRRDKSMVPITLFLYLLWTLGSILGLANVNRDFDQSSSRSELRKVVNTRTVGHGGGRNSSKSYCIASLAEPIDGRSEVQIKYDECGIIRINQDGLEIKLREGALGFSWKTEHSVVRDLDLYRERLGL